MLDFRDFFKQLNKFSCSQTLSKTPEVFFERHGYPQMKFLIGENYNETKQNIYKYVYGESICAVCGCAHTRLISWVRGWAKTCSHECEKKLHSFRQTGDKNTSKRMTDDSKAAMKEKMSVIMRNKILSGEFTPNTTNYARQRPINFHKDDTIKSVRSLWELIFWLQHPSMEHETKRISYRDSTQNKERVYIPDFYDEETNTIYEIRPKCYHHLLADKKNAVISEGYNFVVLDEDYFNLQKTPAMVKMIEDVVCDINDVRSRLKWLKKV